MKISSQVTAEKIYSMFGDVPSKSWPQFVAKHMHASKNGGYFGVSVNNATETAPKWRKQVSANRTIEINRICADVIQAFGYSRDFAHQNYHCTCLQGIYSESLDCIKYEVSLSAININYASDC